VQIYCINLDRSKDRLAHMQRLFSALQHDFIRFPAVDGGLFSESDLAAYEARAIHKLTRGEIGCFLSHFAVWQQIAVGEAPFAAVFEDDIQVSRHMAAFLKEMALFAEMPGAADLIKLETMGTRITLQRQPACIMAGIELYPLVSRHLGSAAYILSKAAAHDLVEQASKLVFPADYIFMNDLPQFHHLKILQALPALAIQDHYHGVTGRLSGFGSTIDQMSLERKASHLTTAAKIRREIGRGIDKIRAKFNWYATARWLWFKQVKIRMNPADILSL